MAADPLMDDDLVDYEDDAVLNDVTEDAASKTEYAPLLPPSSSSFLPLLPLLHIDPLHLHPLHLHWAKKLLVLNS